MNSMKQLVAKAPTPWPQVFLIRNLCEIYGLTSMWKILQAEKWILPRGVEISQVGCFPRALCRSRAEAGGWDSPSSSPSTIDSLGSLPVEERTRPSWGAVHLLFMPFHLFLG